MSKLEINYKHLDNAQGIYDQIVNSWEKFQRWEGWDWEINCKAVENIVMKNDFPFSIVWINSEYEWNRPAIMCRATLHNYWIIVDEDIETSCEFFWPLDVLSLLDDFCQRVSEAKKFLEKK